jgi:malate dehydrogenase (oxaloacetate-decarboxylating)
MAIIISIGLSKNKKTRGGKMNYNEMALKLHKEKIGKIEVVSKVAVENKTDLSIAYTPGVAQPCIEISKDTNKVYDYTAKSNLVAVVSDGSAVLGLGDIGAHAAIPVMEGKAVLFKSFANVDAFPICLNTKNVDEIVNTVKLLEPVFGGINLEDISAPRCFEIERRLKEELDIPVFHDDQHGTAVVTAAAIINSLKLAEKKIEDVQAVINGSGAAGIAIAKLLIKMGINNILMCDRKGILSKERTDLDASKQEILSLTNKYHQSGSLADAMKRADIFIGVSAPNVVTEDMVASMNSKSIVLPMANPVPEIMPNLAKEAGAFIVGTGRSDFPNQVNNVLAFPGIFRGTLDVRAKEINEEMKIAAAYAIADTVGEDLSTDCILPEAFNRLVGKNVAEAVKKAAIDSGVARI